MKKNEKATQNNINQDMEELNRKIQELTTGWQRTQADFLNYKKQTSDDRAKLIKHANENLIAELLPILDNFQLAAFHLPEELKGNNWALGIEQIEKQLENTLIAEGLEKISSVGEHFDPNIHEAIEQVPSDQPEGIIVEEVLSGYKFDGEVIRPAKVKVSSGNPKE